ncbi:PDC sensor domain-containing protein [Patescibacteria group bacterium]|nr:PDC sensor domain-containing protein [Patescibacteria group bacterium]
MKMKKIVFLTVLAILLITTGHAQALEKGPLLNAIKRTTEEKIIKWAKNPIVVNAVKEANIEATRSQDEIIRLDEKWRQIEEVDEWIESYLTNGCADYLKEVQNKKEHGATVYAEIFVMDKQGCIVAETDKTSDFWQGDEDKFIKSFANGKGDIFIDEASYDESTGIYSVQVSVPVLDADSGRAIGAMTVGIDLDLFASEEL